MKKSFVFTARTDAGVVLTQSLVTFGSEDHPWPEDWEDSFTAQQAIHDMKSELIEKRVKVDVSEDLALMDFDEVVKTVLGALLKSSASNNHPIHSHIQSAYNLVNHDRN